MIRLAMSQLRIKHKVFALISLITAFCFFVTYFSLSYAYTTYDDQLHTKSFQLLNLSSGAIEKELSKLEQTSFNIASDEAVQDKLSVLASAASDYEKYMVRGELSDRLVRLTGYEKYIASVQIIDNPGVMLSAGENQVYSEQKLDIIQQETFLRSGEQLWFYPDDEDTALIAARAIRSYKNFELQPIGTLIIRIRWKSVVDDILAGTDLQKGNMYIFNGKLQVFPVGTKMEALSDPSLNFTKAGYAIENIEGHSYFITKYHSNTYGWTYFGLIPYEEIFKRIVLMKQVMLIGFVISLVVLLALSVQFAKGITRPMEDLIVRMKQVQRGDFSLSELERLEPEPATLPKDEVGQLHRTFRIMIQEINELITENYAKQLVIKETQFQALQAQINPHFLYNTLESINWLAKINGQKQISQMVESLGHLLRSSISLKDTVITLDQEIEIVRHYVTIQSFRFEERLQFELDISDSLSGCHIPKLTLQPLVENAIHYALEPSVDPCMIRIYSETDAAADRLTIVVEDHGPGMRPEHLERVLRGEVQTRGKGIGLKNIDERIKLSFGDVYGIRIESELGAGTKVMVDLPLERRTGNV